MRINTSTHITDSSSDANSNEVDIMQIIMQLEEKYGLIFVDKIEDEIFVYKPIGRRDWSEISARTDLNPLEKEDVVCSVCTLYPASYDFSNCPSAGIPTKLYNLIINNSSLRLENLIDAIQYYRNDMATINNKITCIINEAFPNFDIEDIENWGIDKTIKYFSRAEWKLSALRQIELADILEIIQEAASKENSPKEENTNADTSEIVGTKNKMTPEKLMELQRKFPEIDWANASTEI